MSDFIVFKKAIQEKFSELEKTGLYFTDTSKDTLWDTYLVSFPVGSNPIYKERTEHDCQHCKQFIRACGSVVSIINDELVSIWDIEIGGDYQVVADALSKLVKSNEIENKYLHYEASLGTNKSFQQLEDNDINEWGHFHHVLDRANVVSKRYIDSNLGSHKTSIQTFKRALEEISLESINTVLGLIHENSLYRGAEHKNSVKALNIHKSIYHNLSNNQRDLYIWSQYDRSISGIRNSSIGKLLTDLSEGKDLEFAVKAFEKMVAPANYKRPTALITKGMIDKAEKKIEELGFKDSLQRRYAEMDDLTINNVIYANRDTKKSMNVFDEMKGDVSENESKFKDVEEISIKDFISNILPTADSLEMFFANKHINNLVSLISPVIDNAPNILKWGNNFSWSYNGEVTDSIKERVKNAGGKIDAYARCSLSWYNTDDLDIHVIEPDGNEIYHGSKLSYYTGGKLDVDMNVSNLVRNAVENVVWGKDRIREGVYKVYVNNYTARETIDVGFEVEFECNGEMKNFVYDKRVTNNVDVLTFNYSKENGITVKGHIPESDSVKQEWGINTKSFHNVSMVMNSPNHWDTESSGNKHWFFMLDKCNNAGQSRGLYNEFLHNGLNEHRKVFEVLGSKLKTDTSDNQLSGLGFSETKKDSVLCRVSGNRIVKINF